MVLTLGIHSRMGTVRGPNVIGVYLSPSQGGGSVWCLFRSGEGVWGLRPEGLGGNCKSQSGHGGEGRHMGEREGRGAGFVFSLWDESWDKRLARFFGLVL